MAIKISMVNLWRAEVGNTPGALARILEPLALNDLSVVVGYHIHGEASRAVVDIAPIAGQKAMMAARAVGFTPLKAPMLLVEGDNRAGIGCSVAQALGQAGINIDSLSAQVAGRKYQALYGFENEDDLKRAVALIRKASGRPGARARASKKKSSRRASSL